jgi:hypothetical protein
VDEEQRKEDGLHFRNTRTVFMYADLPPVPLELVLLNLLLS